MVQMFRILRNDGSVTRPRFGSKAMGCHDVSPQFINKRKTLTSLFVQLLNLYITQKPSVLSGDHNLL